MGPRAWTKTERSGFLSGRRGRNTEPELVLRRAVHAQGGRYRLHVRVAPRCSADFAFVKERVAIFVDGCFWHGCPEHGKRIFRGPNARLWEEKIARNRLRDSRISRLAKEDGWHVLRFWECEVLLDPERAASCVMDTIRARRGTQANLRTP
jgi:DNA mismatch endonuclease (patch repair protein)